MAGQDGRRRAGPVQRAGGAAVQCGSFVGGHVVKHRLPRDRMPEVPRLEQARCGQGRQGPGDRLGAYLKQLAQQVGAHGLGGHGLGEHGLGEHGDRLTQLDHRGLVPVQAGDNRRAERGARNKRGRPPVGGCAGVLRQRVHQERATAGQAMAGQGQVPGRRGIQVRTEQAGHAGRRQRVQADAVTVSLPEDLGPEQPVSGKRLGAFGQHHQNGRGDGPAGEVGQAMQGCDVGILHVVDGDHHRAVLGQLDQEPEQAFADTREPGADGLGFRLAELAGERARPDQFGG
jgi:hypothetical protein